MHTIGCAPNCGVSFAEPAFVKPDVQGWLLVRPDDAGSAERYVLLEDGDVWIEHEGPREEREAKGDWLAAPSDDLAVLLARSLKSARMGGDGFLAGGEAVEHQVVVEDRRRMTQSFGGRDKRAM